MSEHTFKAEGRNVEGKGASRRLRRAAYIPAIVYGGGAEPQPVQIEHEAVWLASQHGWFYSSILTLDMDGKQQQVLLRDMQRHPFKQLIMHLDFQRVMAGEKLHTKVPLHFTNIDTSPAGKNADVSVTSELNDVEVTCLPKDLPESIEVDLGKMEAGDTVYLADVKLPKGVELVHPVSEEHNPAVAVARAVKVEEEAPVEGDDAADVPATNVSDDDAAAPAAEGDAE